MAFGREFQKSMISCEAAEEPRVSIVLILYEIKEEKIKN